MIFRLRRGLTARIAPLPLVLLLASCTGGDLEILERVNQLAHETPDRFPVHGIDVSKFQGNIDWAAARQAGTEFAFIKATEGGDIFDTRFTDNWNGAAAAGIPRSAYHFYYFCRPAIDQAKWYIKNVPKDKNALPPVLDMEWNGHSPTCTIKPPRAKVLAEMRVFLTRVERHYGQRPIIYSSVDFHDEILEGEFNDYPFWLRSVAGHPKTRYEQRDDWVFWQYTGTGRVSGIKGNVDRNVFAGTKRDWAKWKAAAVPK